MPVDLPGPADLDRVSRHYGLALSEADVASFEPAVSGLLTSWDAVERRYAETAPAMPDRAWTRPSDADNPLGAWYVTTLITGAEGGPPARWRWSGTPRPLTSAGILPARSRLVWQADCRSE